VTVAGLTPFQTVGPFLSLGLGVGLSPPRDLDPHDAIAVTGRLLDGRGEPVPDGTLEFWHPSLRDIVRALTNDAGEFRVALPRPRSIDEPDGVVQAPHYAVRVLARGILTQYLTRVYFPGEPMNDVDPILGRVPVDRRATLVATRLADRAFQFDVVLQGDRETVFFDA
jgi:protocatechuate 3,4-dioxygenase alpha subunit